MSKTIYYFLFLVIFCDSLAFGQNNPPTILDELIIEKNKVTNQSKSQHNIVLNDSIIANSIGSFTDFLQKNTTVYFKENGFGMVSSPAFRGTTAQQTSVLWNGIKINSALLGQTDFNATAFKNYDNIVIKPGGGSVLYGSGAIGGTIHLNNTLEFNKPLQNELQFNYGSFNTQGYYYKVSVGQEKWALNAHFGYNKSDNDYEWIGKDRKNINGNFFNVNFGIETVFKINTSNAIEFYSSFYNDDRHFSLLTPYQTKTKYQNTNSRNLLKWHYKNQSFLNTFYIANTKEHYNYFDALPSNSKSGGNANIWFFKNESFYNIINKLKLSAFIDYQKTTGEGENSSLPFSNQEIFSVSALVNYDVTTKTGFEVGLKNEIAKDYQNPFLFSGGFYFNSKYYQLKLNSSKNYRIPTFNDLYWQPGGSLNLEPETSLQFDLNNTVKYKSVKANLSIYYIDITDMIRWVPTNTGFWEASNTNRVSVLGADFYFNAQKSFNNKHTVLLNANYGYTKSTDETSKKQLTYTPFHKFNIQLGYSYKNFSFFPSFMYVDKIYTTSSNNEDSALKGYGIVDIDLQQKFTISKNLFVINFKIKNVANTAYTNMPERMMPGRNYHIQLIKKF